MLEKLLNKPETNAKLINVGVMVLAVVAILHDTVGFVSHRPYVHLVEWVMPIIFAANAWRAPTRFFRVFFGISAAAMLALAIMRVA